MGGLTLKQNIEQAPARVDNNVERGRPIQIKVDGEIVPAFEGESIAAAMLAAGRRVFRHTHPENQPRGIFCGMGVCFECLVTVVGRRTDSNLVHPARFFGALERLTDGNTIFVGDAGTPTPYISSYVRLKKAGRWCVLPRAHGSLGYALPAAIGAKIAKPGATVLSLIGDSSFGMALGDLETAKRLGLPIIFINFENNSYGWIKTIQRLYFEEKYFAVDFCPVDTVAIAKGFGLDARCIGSNAEIENGLSWALSQNRPVLLSVAIERPTNVVPPVLKWERDSKIPASERKKLTY